MDLQPAIRITEVGWRFQSFTINDLELVDQNSASWNPLTSWLRRLDHLRRAVYWSRTPSSCLHLSDSSPALSGG